MSTSRSSCKIGSGRAANRLFCKARPVLTFGTGPADGAGLRPVSGTCCFSRKARISRDRASTEAGTPARRATWMP